MADLDFIRAWHTRLCLCFESLQALNEIAADRSPEVTQAAQPSLILFRQLLDEAAEKGLAE